MIRRCAPADFEAILAIIEDASRAYRDVIPADRWKDPYMPREELAGEIASGVAFWGYADEDAGALIGVMGLQDVADVTLIRHAYVRTDRQGAGIGGALLTALAAAVRRPLLVGTWAAADWAVRFYEARGFTLVGPEEKTRLLRAYWSIPDRQIATSVVLADRRWFANADRRSAAPMERENTRGGSEMSLTEKTCVPCRGGIPPMPRAEAENLLREIPEWKILDDPMRIERRYAFPDFAAALAFVNRLGALCEAEGHHADFAFGWGYVTATFYTHKIRGLHENDFIMAAKADQAFA